MISLFSFFLIGSFTHKYPAAAGQRFFPSCLLSPFSFTPAPVNLCTMTIACKRSDCRQFFRFCFFRAGLTRQFVFKNFVLIFYYIIYLRVCQSIFRQIVQTLQSATALLFCALFQHAGTIKKRLYPNRSDTAVKQITLRRKDSVLSIFYCLP